MIEKDLGYEMLKEFHNRATVFPSYGLQYDDFMNYLKFPDIYAEGIGTQMVMNNISKSEAAEIMRDLAAQGQGRLPENKLAFEQAIGRRATQINWFTVVKNATADVGTQVAQGVTSVGDNALTIVSTLNKFMVPIALIFVGGWLIANYKKVTK